MNSATKKYAVANTPPLQEERRKSPIRRASPIKASPRAAQRYLPDDVPARRFPAQPIPDTAAQDKGRPGTATRLNSPATATQGRPGTATRLTSLKRVVHGKPYTRDEFIELYGSLGEWDRATPAVATDDHTWFQAKLAEEEEYFENEKVKLNHEIEDWKRKHAHEKNLRMQKEVELDGAYKSLPTVIF